MTRLTTVQKWWNELRVGYSKRWAAQGVVVRPLPYEELSREEKDIVYHFFSTGKLEE